MEPDLIEVIDVRGRTLTPCKRKVAEREVRLHRATWAGSDRIRLRFDPFAYRYVRLKVLERDGYRCYWCGQPGATMDHVIPWSKGGKTALSNCICACEECNGKRGDLPAEEFAALCDVPPPRPWEHMPGQSPSFGPAKGAMGLPQPAVKTCGTPVLTQVGSALAVSALQASALHEPKPELTLVPAPTADELPTVSEPGALARLLDPCGGPFSYRFIR